MPLITCFACEKLFGVQFFYKLTSQDMCHSKMTQECNETMKGLCTDCQYGFELGVLRAMESVKDARWDMFQNDKHITRTLVHVLYQTANFCEREYRSTVHPVMRQEAAKMLLRWYVECNFEVIDKALQDMDLKWPKLQWGVNVRRELGYQALKAWSNRNWPNWDINWDIDSASIVRSRVQEESKAIIEEATTLEPILRLLYRLNEGSVIVDVGIADLEFSWSVRDCDLPPDEH
ncbi:hypothetical protein F5B19DRAFT_492720 [Rostrohypoxylon terebratum]|nr:hypothetical protein F5B19DRAFT_492720 [Rostrohypoxylon terebratum]